MWRNEANTNSIDITNPYREWNTRYPDRRAFGHLCSYAPLEVLHAVGFTPLRLMQASSAVTLADAHLPSFCCALARSVTERMLRGELDYLAGMLFTHTCDTMQCLADVWRMAKPHLAVIPWSMPTVLDQPGAREYLEIALKHFASELEYAAGVPLSAHTLRASIALYNQQRRLLAATHAHLDRLSAEQWWSVMMTGAWMPVEQHVVWLEAGLRSLETSAGAQEPRSSALPRLYLVGAILDDPLIPCLIDELGARVVGDDLCTGSRYWDVEVDEEEDPYVAMAERYAKRAPCPCKHMGGDVGVQRVLRLVQSTRAEGVIFVLPKYCDPQAFEYVTLSRVLSEVKVPHLWLETELTASVSQWRTRLQAFIEMLCDRNDRETLPKTQDGR
jgi:benzoyl-CoA reductase/2-hydroxyglutaryl-CoA dehydratase subunit BcrC/BadD/HgdB